MFDAAALVPRSHIAIGVDPAVRERLPALADGRTLGIDFYASRLLCTNILVGDLTLRWLDSGPSGDTLMPEDFVALSPVDGVAVAAHERLLELLATTGPTIVENGPIFARHLNLRLDDAAAWLEFLDAPRAPCSHS